MQYILPLDTVSRSGVLGLRFLDTVHSTSIHDGLVVTARRFGTTAPKQSASRSPWSGIYSFQTLSNILPNRQLIPAQSLSAFQETIPDVTNIAQLQSLLQTYAGASSDLILSIEDTSGRFLTQVIRVALSNPQLMMIPLFSSPARRSSSGLGVIRGELASYSTRQPCQWALITATLGPHTYAGVTDARGMFTLFVSYNGVQPISIGIAADATQPLSWSLSVHVHYQPDKQTLHTAQEPPDLLSIVSQGNANIYDGGNQTATTIKRTLVFGEDLILRTSPHQAQLFIEPLIA